jgi:predicted alpha/beta hydrolase
VVLRVFEPPAGAPKASVIVPCAMGVVQNFYARFAEWLASQGYSVTTFDYRGIGLSAPASLRGFHVNILDWAREDCAAVIDFVCARHPGVPLYWIGHSLGGQLIGLIPNREHIARVISVAAGSGYWRANAWPTKRFVLWLWYVAAPLAVRLFGYFPGKRLRKVGDLPADVMAQWRRWCLSRDYAASEGEEVRASYASVRVPMLSLSFTDDEVISDEGIRQLHELLYTHAPVEYRRISPAEAGLPRIGHFGFFRAQSEQTLWPLVPRAFA